MNQTNVKRRVAAVIVAYNNAAMLAELLLELRAQTRVPDEIIVIDNASTDGSEEAARRNYPGVNYVRLPVNTGSAGGFREGIRLASTGNDFILTLDDDSGLERDTVESLVRGFEKLAQGRRLGAVRASGFHPRDREPYPLEIASWRGTLFSAAAVQEAGLPDSRYFLYGEDLEYSLRLWKIGYEIFWVPSARCTEKRKEKVSGSVLGMQVMSYHTPLRLYFSFRNEVYIYLHYRRFARAARAVLYGGKVVLFLLVKRGVAVREKIFAILSGITDGLLGRFHRSSGPIVPANPR